MDIMQVLTIAAGVFVGLVAFGIPIGALALAAMIFGLIGQYKDSEKRIREAAVARGWKPSE